MYLYVSGPLPLMILMLFLSDFIIRYCVRHIECSARHYFHEREILFVWLRGRVVRPASDHRLFPLQAPANDRQPPAQALSPRASLQSILEALIYTHALLPALRGGLSARHACVWCVSVSVCVCVCALTCVCVPVCAHVPKSIAL